MQVTSVCDLGQTEWMYVFQNLYFNSSLSHWRRELHDTESEWVVCRGFFFKILTFTQEVRGNQHRSEVSHDPNSDISRTQSRKDSHHIILGALYDAGQVWTLDHSELIPWGVILPQELIYISIYIYISYLLSGQHMLPDRAQCLQREEIGLTARLLLFYILYLHCLVIWKTWHPESITMSSLRRL